MKKKIIALGLVALLGIAPASAAPRGGMNHCGGHQGPAPIRVAPPHHHHVSPAVGVSFSTGVLARRGYWGDYYYGYPIDYSLYNGYYMYPVPYTPSLYMNFRI